MKRLYYVRHGETELNAIGHWAGHIETPLTSKGVSQAKVAGVDIKQKDLKIDLIISSPLSRAHHTAKLIAKEIDYPVDKIQINEMFAERNLGDLEGKSWSKFLETNTLKDMDKVKNAETIAELHIRTKKALDYLYSLKEENILVVSHGSFGRSLYRVIKELPSHLEYDDKHRESIRIGNAELVELI